MTKRSLLMRNIAFSVALAPTVLALLLAGCAREEPSSPQQASLAYLAQSDGYWKAWVSDADGEGARLLTEDKLDVSRISWFPGGRELLVNFQDGRLFRVDVASGERTAIQTQMPGIQDAVISPDGKRIAFSYGVNESTYDNDVWMLDMASGEHAKLTSTPGLQHDPAWSADGEWLYFLSGMGGQFHDIWRLKLSDRSMEQVTVNELYHFDLSLREDGVIAYSGNRNGNYDLWLRHPDGESEALTNDVALDARPAWSADGRSLIFESTREGGLDLWKLDIDTRQIARLTKTPDGARMPVIASLGADE